MAETEKRLVLLSSQDAGSEPRQAVLQQRERSDAVTQRFRLFMDEELDNIESTVVLEFSLALYFMESLERQRSYSDSGKTTAGDEVDFYTAGLIQSKAVIPILARFCPPSLCIRGPDILAPTTQSECPPSTVVSTSPPHPDA